MQSRRAILRRGAGIAGAGVVASLAGCSDAPVVGSFFDERLAPADWAYDPSELDRNWLSLMGMRVDTLLEAADVPDGEKDEVREDITEGFDDALAADDVDDMLGVGGTEILAGSFDTDDVLEELDVSEADGYGDYDVYSSDAETGSLFATDGELILRSDRGGQEARDELELVIDTGAGDADGFAETNDDVEHVLAETDDDAALTSVSASTASAREDANESALVASGASLDIDGAETNGQFVYVFTDEDGIDLEEIESDLEDDLATDDGELTDISQDGRFVYAEATLPTEEV